jgi:gliding motility-associated-like protein
MNLSKVFLTLTFIFCLWGAQGQNEANVWYFGMKNGLDFSTGEPVVLTDGVIETFEGSASYCDADGKLLFYTNGGGRLPSSGESTGAIWNANHEVMYDMGGAEGGGFSSAQSAIIFPKPGSDHSYCLFTMEELEFNVGGSIPSQPQGRGLSYFEIDMNLNGGLGGVTVADERLFVPAFESLTAIQHENGEDYWVVAVHATTGEFITLLVDEQGIHDPELQAPQPLVSSFNLLKVSPDRSRIFNGKALYRFDTSTGIISDPTSINLPASSYQSTYSFSPNSKYLYRLAEHADTARVLQYDVNAADVSASAVEIGSILGNHIYGQMQLGPDGNIYFITNNLFIGVGMGLSRINCPNSATPTIEPLVVTFPADGTLGLGLPNFTDHLFNNQNAVSVDLGPENQVICTGETLTLETGVENAEYLWSTGETSPTITVNSPGVYSVTVTEECGSGTDQITVEVKTPPTFVDIVGEDMLCTGEEIALTIYPEDFSLIEWSTGESTPTITITSGGTYEVYVETECGDYFIHSFVVNEVNTPEVAIEGDPSICLDGGTNVLTAQVEGSGQMVMNWSTGGQGLELEVSEPGIYTFWAGNECGEMTASMDVYLENCQECVQMPTAFSPNNDGMNDEFCPLFDCDVESFRIEIYSRWGQKVFEASDPDSKWDGTFRGKDLAEDVFIYKMSYTISGLPNELVEQGDLTLMR